MDAADEDLGVFSTRMSATIAERRVLALRADLKRTPRSRQLVAAVSAHAEHATYIGSSARGLNGLALPQQPFAGWRAPG